MPSQADYDKIQKCVITPMLEFYETKMNAAQIQAFVEDLCSYSERVLDAAWKQVRRESKFVPKLAHFVEACSNQSSRGAERSVPQSDTGYRISKNASLADEVMRSELGQLALRLGAGQGIWMRAWRDNESPTEKSVYAMRDSVKQAVKSLAEFPDKQSPYYRSLQGLWNSIEDKERELVKTYLRAA